MTRLVGKSMRDDEKRSVKRLEARDIYIGENGGKKDVEFGEFR